MATSNNNASWSEVEEILDKKISTRNQRVQYLVKWKSSGDDNGPTEEWVFASDCNCPSAIYDYEKSIGEKEDEYEVEGIIDSIKRNVKMEYLVKWKDYDVKECSWVKEDDMHCKGLVNKFHKGKVYKHEDLRYVKNVKKMKLIDGFEHFKVEWDDEEGADNGFHSYDDIYVMPNGRNAIAKYQKIHNKK